MAKLTPELDRIISQLDREKVVALLQEHCGIQCYVHESLAILREALKCSLKDGDLSEQDIRDAAES